MSTKFIKVRKDNRTHDRGFIAVDAICSVFENGDSHNVSIMTMDGFWYDVNDDVETLYNLIIGIEDKKHESVAQPKKDYFRRKKMMQPTVANDKSQQNHDDFRNGLVNSVSTSESDDVDVFKPVPKKAKGKRVYASRTIPNDLSAGAGEGQNNSDSMVETPPMRRIPEEGL